MIVILGPTATGKTALAAELCYRINGEVISADSRQVYRDMDIGTGKDLADFNIHNTQIPYHLVNVADAGFEYNIFHYQHQFHKSYNDILLRGKKPVLCGGSGLYIETVLKGFNLHKVPDNIELRKNFESKSDEELIQMLSGMQKLHNKTDTNTRERLIKALIIAFYLKETKPEFPSIDSVIFGVFYERNIVRERITQRLKQRLENGLIEEAEMLLNKGLTLEKFKYYGLEYKFLALSLEKKITYQELFSQLNIAIHQFSKRQMTWFRKMEKEGFKINWIDGNLSMDEKINFILERI